MSLWVESTFLNDKSLSVIFKCAYIISDRNFFLLLRTFPSFHIWFLVCLTWFSFWFCLFASLIEIKIIINKPFQGRGMVCLRQWASDSSYGYTWETWAPEWTPVWSGLLFFTLARISKMRNSFLLCPFFPWISWNLLFFCSTTTVLLQVTNISTSHKL